MHVSSKCVLDTTEVVLRDDVTWECCVTQVDTRPAWRRRLITVWGGGCCPKSIPKVYQLDHGCIDLFLGGRVWSLSVGLTLVCHECFLYWCNEPKALQTPIYRATSPWFAPACRRPIALWRSSVSFGIVSLTWKNYDMVAFADAVIYNDVTACYLAWHITCSIWLSFWHHRLHWRQKYLYEKN